MSESSNDFDTEIDKGTDDIKPNIVEGKQDSEEDVNESMISEIASSSDIKTRLRKRTNTKSNTTTIKNRDYVVLSSSDEGSNDSTNNNNNDMSTGEEHEEEGEYVPDGKKRKSPRAPLEPVPCLYCSSASSFPTEKELNIHIKEQHASEPPAYCCNECSKKFKNNVFLTNHKKRVHNYKYISKNDRRLKKKRGPKKKKERKSRARFGCDFPGCTTRYDTEKALEKHKKLHENETTVYNCPVCSEPYPNKFALSCHMGWKHPDNSARYPCRIKYRVYLPDGQKAMKRCKASFATKSELFKHRRKKHAPKVLSDEDKQQEKESDSTNNLEQSLTTTTTEDIKKELKGNDENPATTSHDINNVIINIDIDSYSSETINNSTITFIPVPAPTPVKKRPYPCLVNNCPRSFATSRTRANHMEINHGIKYT